MSAPPARVLVTGASGQTGGAVARGLRERGVAVRTAGRGELPGDHVAFDWLDASGHDRALDGVDAVYLVAPAFVADPAPVMVPFVERALARGARRLVLLSASAVPEGTPGLGVVHGVLRERVPGWTVLQPSWFMQNFFDRRHWLAASIARSGEIVTATGDGRVGFIDSDDIAAVAVQALVTPAREALRLTGPAALSYAEAAAVLAEALGRPVVHRPVPVDAFRARLAASGVPDAYASFLATLDGQIAAGSEDIVTDAVARWTGRPPRSLADLARERLARDG
ncbi:MAG: hypothetical protein EOO75_07565 [Myxococcales bacterium]|nr:MAG: hypothetical protein EOO75_07565 [Myxococcales bacterium]